jgi:hypothetical protein
MSHGASAEADSIRRTAQVCPRVISTRSGISLALIHQRVAVKRRGRRHWSRPPAGEAGRARASLDRRRLVRHRLAKRDDGTSFRSAHQDAELGSMPSAHCADTLTAREILRSCNVCSYQEKCDKALYYLTTDRGAPCALYPAIKRSVVRASPGLRYPSQDRRRKIPGQAGREQVRRGFGAVNMPGLC